MASECTHTSSTDEVTNNGHGSSLSPTIRDERPVTDAFPMTDEVLAHIAAPATRQADDLYHALADAYHDFTPCTSLHGRHAGDAQHGAAMANTAQTSMISISRETYGSFPSYLSSESQGPDAAEQGSLPTSSRLSRLEYMHRDWKKRTALGTSFAHRPASAQDVPRDSANHASASFIEDTQEAMISLQSQLQVTTSMSSGFIAATEDSYLEHDDVAQAPQDPNVSQNAARETLEVPSLTAGLADISSSVMASAHCAVPAGTAVSPESSSPIAPEQRQVVHDRLSAVQLTDVSELPLNVFPPPPPISTAQYRKLPSQITQYLGAVKARHPNHFKLITKKYTPKAYDRGYWAVDCAQWSSKVQIDFWLEMQGLVQDGKLGWGTTLHRVEGASPAICQARLYCWAEVAEHMWLQLWLSSGGRVGRRSVKWYDADGVAIFEAVLGSQGKALGACRRDAPYDVR